MSSKKGIPLIRLFTYYFNYFVPLFGIIKSIENNNTSAQIRWLCYFLLTGLFLVFEQPLKIYLPYWTEFKLIILLALQFHDCFIPFYCVQHYILPLLKRIFPYLGKIIEFPSRMIQNKLNDPEFQERLYKAFEDMNSN